MDTKAAGVQLKAVEIGLSGERAAHLTLDGARVDDDAVLGVVGQGQELLEWLEERANIAHCALQVGVTEAAMTVPPISRRTS